MENNNNVNIPKLYDEISKIKNPAIFLFSLISYKNEIHDYNFSIILRIFIKFHSNFMLDYNIKNLFANELDKYSLSWCVLVDFYKILAKKIPLVFVLKKWHTIYDNDIFWKMPLYNQIDYLSNIKDRFLSIYDCSRGGVPFHYKLAQIFKIGNYCKKEIINNIIDRIFYILDIFGKSVFTSLDIPLILIYDFYNLSNENILKYIIIIYDKFNELLNQTIKLFDSYNLICIQLNNLINPSFITIKSIQIDSETEDDDIKLLSLK